MEPDTLTPNVSPDCEPEGKHLYEPGTLVRSHNGANYLVDPHGSFRRVMMVEGKVAIAKKFTKQERRRAKRLRVHEMRRIQRAG